MIKLTNVGFAALLLLPLPTFADTSANSQTVPNGTASGESMGIKQHIMQWTLNDQKFVDKAVEGGRAEVELSKLALERSQNSQVRNFAQKMVNDHTTASLELKGIAQGKNLQVPVDMDSAHKKDLDKLQSLNGAQFDAKYIDLMQKDHDKTVSLFVAASNDKKLDPQLQNFAQKTLPELREHLSQVRALNAGAQASTSR